MAGALTYALSLKTLKFTGPLGAAQGALGSFSTGVGGLLTKLGPMTAALTGAAGAAGSFGLALKSFNAAADIEQTQVALRTLVGDIGKADKLLKDVRDLGASTPFQFPELADSARKLVAFGEAAEDVPGLLRRIGDVAAGSQTPISQLATIYGKARVAGTLYAEDINQLIDAGIPIMDMLAKVTGRNASEIKKLASEGKITFPFLDQAFRNATGEGGKFFQMMEKQSKTSRGLISTLKDNVHELFITLGTPINDALKPVFKDAIVLVKRIGLGLSGLVDIVKGALAQGNLGEIVGTSIKIGLQEGVNFGVGAFLFLGEGLFRTFEFSLRQVWTLLTGGFNQAFGNIFGGLGKILLGVGKLILSRLGDPFREVVAVFQAGLFFAIDQLLVKLGNSKLGNMLGFEKINATSFEEALADFREKMDVGKLKGEGEKLIKDGLGQTGQAIKQSLDVSSENFRKSFDGLKFDPVSIFNTEEDKKALIDMLKQANPEGFKKIIDALNPPIESLKDTADKVDNAVNQARDIDKAVKKLNAPKPDKAGKGQAGETGRSGRKRIRLFNAADSLRRRFARQSKEDKTTFDDFVNKSGSNRSVVRRFARNNGISFADALKQLQAGGAAASPRRGGRIAAEKERLEAAKRMATEATLLRIATHLESIATA